LWAKADLSKCALHEGQALISSDRFTRAGVWELSVAVEAKSVVKVFGNIRALDGLSFTVKSGEIFGLIGPNGAGKTTALRIISTLILPTSGEVKVFGVDVVDKADEVRRFITYLPEEAGAYRNLSGWEYLELWAVLWRKTRMMSAKWLKRQLKFVGWVTA
jgi:ABC-2 type transport system ATP-binding protein